MSHDEPRGQPGPLEVVEAHVAAFNACDVDAVVDSFADDAVFAAGDHVVVGARALRTLFADAFGAPVRAELTLRRAVVQDQAVAVELTERLTLADSVQDLDVAGFFTVRRGRLARVRIYRDLIDAEGRV